VTVSSIRPLVSAQELGGGRYLIGGSRSTYSLHVWSRETDEIERSFLQIRIPEKYLRLAGSYPSVFAIVERDTIWATWALADTVYKFDRDGNRLGGFPIPLPRTEGWISSGDVELTGSQIAELPEVVSSAGRLFLLNDGGFVIV